MGGGGLPPFPHQQTDGSVQGEESVPKHLQPLEKEGLVVILGLCSNKHRKSLGNKEKERRCFHSLVNTRGTLSFTANSIFGMK